MTDGDLVHARRTVTAMTSRDTETSAMGAWSLKRVSVRIMWALLIGGLAAFVFGSSGSAGTFAVIVMVIAYIALTAIARRR